MEQLHQLQEQLGLMTWPLIICSALTVMIIIERLFQVMISLGVGKRAIRNELNQISPSDKQQLEALAEKLSPRRPLPVSYTHLTLPKNDQV